MPRDNLIQVRNGSFSEWLSVNPVLSSGEFGYDYTSNILKIGAGVVLLGIGGTKFVRGTDRGDPPAVHRGRSWGLEFDFRKKLGAGN